MGWCSATIIFDQIAQIILDDKPIDKKTVLRTVIDSLEEGDWDCQHDSEYWDHPLVQEIMRDKHPHWFEDN